MGGCRGTLSLVQLSEPGPDNEEEKRMGTTIGGENIANEVTTMCKGLPGVNGDGCAATRRRGMTVPPSNMMSAVRINDA